MLFNLKDLWGRQDACPTGQPTGALFSSSSPIRDRGSVIPEQDAIGGQGRDRTVGVKPPRS
jgi:hypothetical protein